MRRYEAYLKKIAKVKCAHFFGEGKKCCSLWILWSQSGRTAAFLWEEDFFTDFLEVALLSRTTHYIPVSCIDKFPPDYSRIANDLSMDRCSEESVFLGCLPKVSKLLFESFTAEFGYERFSRNTEKIILRTINDPDHIYKAWKVKPRIVDDIQLIDFQSGWAKVELSYLCDVTALDLIQNIQRQNGLSILTPIQIYFAPQLDSFLKGINPRADVVFPLVFREPLDETRDSFQKESSSRFDVQYEQILKSAVCVTQEDGELWGVIFRINGTDKMCYLNDFCFRNVARQRNTLGLRSHDSTVHLIDVRRHPEFRPISEYLAKQPPVVFPRSQYASGHRGFRCISFGRYAKKAQGSEIQNY